MKDINMSNIYFNTINKTISDYADMYNDNDGGNKTTVNDIMAQVAFSRPFNQRYEGRRDVGMDELIYEHRSQQSLFASNQDGYINSYYSSLPLSQFYQRQYDEYRAGQLIGLLETAKLKSGHFSSQEEEQVLYDQIVALEQELFE